MRQLTRVNLRAPPLCTTATDKMNSDSGMTASLTPEEDTLELAYCLKMHERPPSILDRALLEPGSTSAQLEALSRQVQSVLSLRLKPKQSSIEEQENEDGFELTVELAGLSRARSLSPALSDSTQPQLEMMQPKLEPSKGLDKRRKAVIKQSKSLDAYQKYPTTVSGSMRRSSVGASSRSTCSSSDKYRLSFVDIYDSSSDEQEHADCLNRPVSLNTVSDMDPTTFNSINQDHVSNEEFGSGKADVKRNETVGKCESEATTHTEFESVQNMSIGQHSDIQYDDDEIVQYHNRPNKRTLCNSGSNSPGKKVESTMATTKKDAKENNTTVQSKVLRSVDHASFSPLYTMSVDHLQYILQLLETKLQSNGFTPYKFCTYM